MNVLCHLAPLEEHALTSLMVSLANVLMASIAASEVSLFPIFHLNHTSSLFQPLFFLGIQKGGEGKEKDKRKKKERKKKEKRKKNKKRINEQNN